MRRLGPLRSGFLLQREAALYEAVAKRFVSIVAKIKARRPRHAAAGVGPDGAGRFVPVRDARAAKFKPPTYGPSTQEKLKPKLTDAGGDELQMVRVLTDVEAEIGDV